MSVSSGWLIEKKRHIEDIVNHRIYSTDIRETINLMDKKTEPKGLGFLVLFYTL